MKDIFEQLDIEYTEDIGNKFSQYADILIEWNKKFNLTAITQKDEIYLKHFADSLLIFNSLYNIKGLNGKGSLLDIGSGAGFPGIPLKIAGYTGKIVLLESNGKKCSFLQHVIQELKLNDIHVANKRAEQGGRDTAYRENFDIVTARAVAPLNVLMKYASPFLKTNGVFAAMKTNKEEIYIARNAMKQLNLVLDRIDNQSVPLLEAVRCNMYFKKTRKISPLYPRADGTPKKKPL